MTLKNTSAQDLVKDLEAKREELRALRFDLAGTKQKKTAPRKEIRKHVARILTELKTRTA